MTAPADYAVHGPDRGREVHETAPVAKQDKRFPHRTPPGDRRRRRQTDPQDTAPTPDSNTETAPDNNEDPPKTSTGGEDHVIDTLA